MSPQGSYALLYLVLLTAAWFLHPDFVPFTRTGLTTNLRRCAGFTTRGAKLLAHFRAVAAGPLCAERHA